MLPSRSRGVGEYRELAATLTAAQGAKVVLRLAVSSRLTCRWLLCTSKDSKGDSSDSSKSLKHALRPIGRSQEADFARKGHMTLSFGRARKR